MPIVPTPTPGPRTPATRTRPPRVPPLAGSWRGAGSSRRSSGGGGEVRHPGRQRHCPRQDRHAPLGIGPRQDGCLVGLHVPRRPVARQVPPPVRQVEVHHHPDGHHRHGIPRLRLETEERELGRERFPDVVEPRVHARRVGQQAFAFVEVEPLRGAFRGPPQVEGAQEPVGPDEVPSEHLGQPTRRDPSEELHLPHSVGGVEVAQGPEHVRLRTRVDGRNPERVHLDDDRLEEAGSPHAAAGRQGRAGKTEPADGDDQARDTQECGGPEDDPAERAAAAHSRPEEGAPSEGLGSAVPYPFPARSASANV